MTPKHQTTKISEGEYQYRGYTITRHDDVPSGYFGRWRAGGYRKGFASDTLKGVKAQIDAKLDRGN